MNAPTTLHSKPLTIRRLGPEHAANIEACIRRVYGETYANESFYDVSRLRELMRSKRLFSVGAVRDDGEILGHMAMSRRSDAASTELGNSIIDPDARGQGLIWKLGAELVSWSMEFGDNGFVDYPTTAHHIMQRESVKTGSETGLMLSYIPADTDGKVSSDVSDGREAATIVYHPYPGRSTARIEQVLPSYCDALVKEMADGVGALRTWRRPGIATVNATSQVARERHERRDLLRVTVTQVGSDIAATLSSFDDETAACKQIDFAMSDLGIEAGVNAALGAGYWFCGWLPGFWSADAFRMQKVDRTQTNMRPLLVNEVAQSLLELAPDRP